MLGKTVVSEGPAVGEASCRQYIRERRVQANRAISQHCCALAVVQPGPQKVDSHEPTPLLMKPNAPSPLSTRARQKRRLSD